MNFLGKYRDNARIMLYAFASLKCWTNASIMYKSLQGARKNGGKTRVYIWRERQTKTSSIQLKLLLPAILINLLPRFIEKIRKHN